MVDYVRQKIETLAAIRPARTAFVARFSSPRD
jgi:hypothetical protein